MLPPIYYESCTDAVLAAYARLEDAILSAMVKRILRIGFVSEATKHQAEMLQEAGLLYEDILQLIAQRTDACTAQVRALFEDAGVTAVEMDNQAYRKAGIATVDIRQSDSLRQVLEAGFKKTMGVMDNLTKTTALTTQRSFYKACNDAYMQISSGAFSYHEAIRNVLKQAAQDGLSVEYPSGHVDKLDVAIRRAALTGVGQTAAEVSKTNAEENGCYLMEITAHSGARPEHAKWQGQLVSLTGKDVGKTIDGLKVWSLRGIGYGDGDGFRGWNCRHDWFPYFPGLSVPNYTKKELEQLDEKRIAWNGEKYTEYEISQMQRARERNVRKLKRQTMSMQQAAELTDNPELKEAATADYQATAAKLKAAEKDLQTFCNQTGQDRDRFREQVLGFSRSEAQNAVHAAKKTSIDYMARFTPSYSDQKSIKTGTIEMRVKKVSNSKFTMYTDAEVTRKNKAVRFVEKSMEKIQKGLPNDFKIPEIAVVDFDKHHINPYAIGGYDKTTGIMYINSKYDTKEKVLAFVNKNKGQFANETEYAPFLHELGHKYYEDCIKKLAISENIGYNESKKKIDRRIFDYIESKHNPDFVLESISGYASGGESSGKFTEIIAECFSVRGENSVADKILKLLE